MVTTHQWVRLPLEISSILLYDLPNDIISKTVRCIIVSYC